MREPETHSVALPPELEAEAATALEWPRLLEALAERALSEPGKIRLQQLSLAPTLEQARQRTARVREVLELGERGVELPRAEFADLAEPLGRLRLGAIASAAELAQIARLLQQAQTLRRLAEAHADPEGELFRVFSSDPLLDRLLARLSESVEPSGTISDRASRALAEARARVREAGSELRKRLGDLAERHADVLQGRYFTEREGRYVLPVRADAHYRFDGIVLGSSGSGSTLFIEPTELTALGNRLRVQEAAVGREVARVLSELSDSVRERLTAVEGAFDACLEADVLTALARFAVETRSHPIEVGAEPRFEVLAARHPLLVLLGGDIVPNDLLLRSGQALVISGPNAGGKTVSLKCLGLFAWMARAGIPIPAAAESYIGWFDRVFADVGDDQSLIRSLSSFSAHVRNLAAILAHSRSGVLVLLDELAAGTDPEEGAALAGAVLEALTQLGAAVGATTHYERLKELATGDGVFENASVGFDFDRMEPTFRLTLGLPGPSSALAVARRHGLSETVLSRARELLPETTLDRERLLNQLLVEQERILSARQALEAERRDQAARLSALEEADRHERDLQRSRFDREIQLLLSQVREARSELQKAKSQLSGPGLGRAELATLERTVSRVAAKVAVGGPLAPVPQPTAPVHRIPSRDLVPGARVRLRLTGAIGVVIDPPERGRIHLRVGSMRLVQRVEDLESAPPKAASSPRKTQPARALESLPAPQRTRDTTLDLRGVRVEDASGSIDAFVDRLIRAGESVGFVLHGHGTGALRSAVRTHLQLSPQIERTRAGEPDEGGEAVTAFWMR